MSSISEYKYDLKRYKTIKSYLNTIANELSYAIDNANDVGNSIKSRYLVNDDYTPIVSRSRQLSSNLTSERNYIRNRVIPAINLAIRDLEKKIAAG